jgi:hypothetical protein
MSCLWIVLLSVAGLTATATTAGAETDIVGAIRHLPRALLVVAPSIALFALLIFPIALAISQFTRHQARRLIDAVAAGLLAGVVTTIVNAILTRPFAEQLYGAIIMSRSGVRHVPALDPYLAGLIAYVTIIGLTGRTAWRNALWLAWARTGSRSWWPCTPASWPSWSPCWQGARSARPSGMAPGRSRSARRPGTSQRPCRHRVCG